MELQEKTTGSRYIYRGRIVNLRVDRVQMPGGREAEREVVEHRGAAAVVAFAPEGVMLVKQYRHPVGEILLEIPAGKLESREDPLDCARRELSEETGYYPHQLHLLGSFYTSPGFSSELIHIYLAGDLEWKPLPADQDERVELLTLPLAHALAMIAAGKIKDAKTITGLLLAAKLQ